MNKKVDLKKYLEQNADLIRNFRSYVDWKYRSYEELILDGGLQMLSQPLPKNIKLLTPKSCYYNCQKLASSNEELIYVEGYAIAHNVSLPLSHAWLMDRDGHAIDPTWETTGTAYFGVPLATVWVESFLRLRGRRDDLSIFDGNHLENYSLLKQGLPVGASTLSTSTNQTGVNIL